MAHTRLTPGLNLSPGHCNSSNCWRAAGAQVCVVWCGVVWCGVVWCGVWCNVVWHGVVEAYRLLLGMTPISSLSPSGVALLACHHSSSEALMTWRMSP